MGIGPQRLRRLLIGVKIGGANPVRSSVEPTGLAEMHVRIDQPRRDESAREIDGFDSPGNGARLSGTDTGQTVAFNENNGVFEARPSGAIDDGCAHEGDGLRSRLAAHRKGEEKGGKGCSDHGSGEGCMTVFRNPNITPELVAWLRRATHCLAALPHPTRLPRQSLLRHAAEPRDEPGEKARYNGGWITSGITWETGVAIFCQVHSIVRLFP